MKAVSIRFLVSAALGYALCAAFGWTLAPTTGNSLDPSEAAAALRFAFPDAGDGSNSWHAPEGTATRGRLIRRAYVHGHLDSSSGPRYSEQVLKVGWPFTVVRGFIRSSGTELRTRGAYFVGPAAVNEPVRMLPMQPVWPGIIVVGLAGALAATAIASRRAKSAGAGPAP